MRRGPTGARTSRSSPAVPNRGQNRMEVEMFRRAGLAFWVTFSLVGGICGGGVSRGDDQADLFRSLRLRGVDRMPASSSQIRKLLEPSPRSDRWRPQSDLAEIRGV